MVDVAENMSEIRESQNVKSSQDLLLEKLATAELLREASRGAIRAETLGPSGWLKCPLPKTNKTFLKNTIKHAVVSNNYNYPERLKTPSENSNKDCNDKYKRFNDRKTPYKKRLPQ